MQNFRNSKKTTKMFENDVGPPFDLSGEFFTSRDQLLQILPSSSSPKSKEWCDHCGTLCRNLATFVWHELKANDPLLRKGQADTFQGSQLVCLRFFRKRFKKIEEKILLVMKNSGEKK